jgi:hypothetical protein
VLRAHYTDLIHVLTKRLGALPALLLMAGCSLSVPGLGGADAPLTTGSIAQSVTVQKPLPQTLAYSDARKIGQAALATLSESGTAPSLDWENAATGSSGTIERESKGKTAGGNDCRPFHTIVTSIGGVHRYAGSICRKEAGPSVVAIEGSENGAG